MSITVQVPIPEELIANLEQRAQNVGHQREQYLSQLFARELSSPPGLDEVLSGFRAEVKASGISDSELTDLFNQERADLSTRKP